MSSIGASCADVYLKRKQQKEKMKKIEEERVKRGEITSSSGINNNEDRKLGGRSKVHPSNFTNSSAPAPSAETQGRWSNAP